MIFIKHIKSFIQSTLTYIDSEFLLFYKSTNIRSLADYISIHNLECGRQSLPLGRRRGAATLASPAVVEGCHDLIF